MRDISLYLQDILDAMLAVERFVEGMSFDEFKHPNLPPSIWGGDNR